LQNNQKLITISVAVVLAIAMLAVKPSFAGYNNFFTYSDFNVAPASKSVMVLDKNYTSGIKIYFTNWVQWNMSEGAACGHIWIVDQEGSGKTWDLAFKQMGALDVWYDSGSGAVKLASFDRSGGWATDGSEKVIFQMANDRVTITFQNSTTEVTVLEAGFEPFTVDRLYAYGDTQKDAISGYMDVQIAGTLSTMGDSMTEMIMAIMPIAVLFTLFGTCLGLLKRLGKI